MSYKHLFAMDCKMSIHSIVRVDCAGEYGAIKIYQNQIRVLPSNEHLHVMLDCELNHYEYFIKISQKLGIQKTVFLPLWKVMSSMMGYLSAKISSSDAMLCTHAVETVIEQHYQKQISELSDILEYARPSDTFVVENHEILKDLLSHIQTFLLEEIEHKNIGENNSKMDVIRFSITKLAVWLAIKLSEKI